MNKLDNALLTATVNPLGAELKSLVLKTGGNRELLWPGKADVWPRSSPVLFPIVGKLKDNTYHHNGRAYTLSQHGFARDMDFALINQSETQLTYRLEHSPETLEKYPFPFILDIFYTLEKSCLRVSYRVENPAREAMYFSLGAHPGFICKPGLKSSDVKATVQMDMPRELLVYRLEGGLLQNEATEGLISSLEGRIDLTDDLIENDAMVFKQPMGRWMDLRVEGTRGFLRLTAKGWPYFGMWSKKGAPFLCLEPWHGLADGVGTTQQLAEKEGIIQLAPGQAWQAEWSVEVR